MREDRDSIAETMENGPGLNKPKLDSGWPASAETLAVPPTTAIDRSDPARDRVETVAVLEVTAADLTIGRTPGLAATEPVATVAVGRGEAPTEQGTGAWSGAGGGAQGETIPEVDAGSQHNRAAGGVSVVLPGYEMLAEIGRGGMGVVYKARQVRLDRPVALKMVLAGAHASPEMLERFHIEAQAVAQLQHPGIVQIHEVGEHDGLPYFSLEFVAGGSLAQKLAGKPQLPREAAWMVRELALAMHEAHARGIIHRDLKPANVLLTVDGKPKITDFGLAKRMEGDSGQTRSGAIMGTPSYMSPEQAWGKTREIGPLADQYALGAILYEMLVGRPPFAGSTALETLELARTQEPVPPTRLQPKVPADLETICLKCLQKEPGKRYADDAALAGDLGRFLDGQPILARPVGAPERLARWCRRNPRVAGLAAAVAALLLAVTGISTASAAAQKTLNDRLKVSNVAEKAARATADAEKAAAVEAKVEADRARVAADEARKKEAEARKKAEQLVMAARAGNVAAIKSHRFISILANQRMRMFPGTQDVRKELADRAALDLAGTMKVLEELAPVARDVDGEFAATKTLAGVNQQAGRVMDELGRFDEAGAFFRRMDVLVEALAAADPGKVELLFLRAVSKSTLADFEMYRQFDSASAMPHFRQALEFRRRLLATRPEEDEYKRGVANSLGALARAYLKLGDPIRARDCYVEEAALRDTIAPRGDDAFMIRRERAGLEEKLGDLALALGDVAGGRGHYERSLEMRESVADDAPNESLARRDVLLSFQKLGILHMIHLGDQPGARAWFDKALAEFEARFEADRQSVAARDDVARIHYYLGTACLRAGDRKASDEHFRKSLATRELGGPDLKAKVEAMDMMLARARCGQHERASKIASDLMRETPTDSLVAYNVACGYALCAAAAAETPAAKDLARRYADEAVKALRVAVEKGWRGLAELETDPDLDPIRGEPGFAAAVEDVRKAAKA